ncbi:MAG: arylformamidase [Alphaproteobacteria bacterium]
MADKRKLWDISPPIRVGIPVWPGDTAYDEERVWELDETCPVNVSRFTMSTHTGAHADAPLHYDKDGVAAGRMDLARYLGPCRVVDGRQNDGVITAAMLAPFLTAGVERILVRTYDEARIDVWDESFAAIEPDAIALLAAKNIVLIGVDTPSLDPQDSKTMEAHQMVRRHGLSILEGLVLDEVPSGDYELIALPLKLMTLDSAPVRAVLRSLP